MKRLAQQLKVSTQSTTNQGIAKKIVKDKMFVMTDAQLKKVIPFLSKRGKSRVLSELDIRRTNPVNDYKGLWEKLSNRQIQSMSRGDAIRKMKKLLRAWSRFSGSKGSEPKYKSMSTAAIKKELKLMVSPQVKQLAAQMIRLKRWGVVKPAQSR